MIARSPPGPARGVGIVHNEVAVTSFNTSAPSDAFGDSLCTHENASALRLKGKPHELVKHIGTQPVAFKGGFLNVVNVRWQRELPRSAHGDTSSERYSMGCPSSSACRMPHSIPSEMPWSL